MNNTGSVPWHLLRINWGDMKRNHNCAWKSNIDVTKMWSKLYFFWQHNLSIMYSIVFWIGCKTHYVVLMKAWRPYFSAQWTDWVCVTGEATGVDYLRTWCFCCVLLRWLHRTSSCRCSQNTGSKKKSLEEQNSGIFHARWNFQDVFSSTYEAMSHRWFDWAPVSILAESRTLVLSPK